MDTWVFDALQIYSHSPPLFTLSSPPLPSISLPIVSFILCVQQSWWPRRQERVHRPSIHHGRHHSFNFWIVSVGEGAVGVTRELDVGVGGGVDENPSIPITTV